MENFQSDLGIHNILIIRAENKNREIEQRIGKKLTPTECYLYEDCILELFCIKTGSGYKKIPFFVDYNFKKGLFISQYNGLIKNMIECFTSCIRGGIEYITQEPLTLRFFRPTGDFSVHNVFTSIYYSTKIILHKVGSQQIKEKMLKFLGINSIEVINDNYFKLADKSLDHLILLRFETKIFFWWNLYFKNREISDNIYFTFYLWCFRNLPNLDKPTIFGSNRRNAPMFGEYFSIINNCDDPIDLLILRYGPLKLTPQELLTKPNKIFTCFKKRECKERINEMFILENDIKNMNDDYNEEQEDDEIFNMIDNMNFKK